MSRIGGFIEVAVDGVQFLAKGDWTYNIGREKKEMIVGADRVHGHTAKPQVPFIEGAITDTEGLDLAGLQDIEDATVTLNLANGKVIVLRNAIYAADGSVTTAEGEIEARFEGIEAEEIR